jgi:uncharacterized beta-barrel protein YwiB (DUF1934 family)
MVTSRAPKVFIDVDDKGGRVELKYKMEAAGALSIDNSMELSIREIN